MVSTVLNDKNGVITEDRFQKMTLPQWIFHFHEVARAKKQANLKFKTMLRQVESAGLIAHPKTDRAAVVQKISERDLAEHSKDIVEDLVGFMNEMKDIFPETLDIQAIVSEQPKFFLPTHPGPTGKRRRAKGIVIGEEPQDGDGNGQSQLGQ